jgi:hypothetical protein
MSRRPDGGGDSDGAAPRASASPNGHRSLRSALEEAANEVRRRQRLLRWVLIGAGGALATLGVLLLSTPR